MSAMPMFGNAPVEPVANQFKFGDGPLVRLAVKLGARIVSRYKWAVVCGGCHLPIKREEWVGHRCD